MGKINKKYTMRLILIFLLFPCLLFGQKEDNLVSRNRPGLFWYFNGTRPIKDADYRKYNRFIIDATYNTWLGDINPFQNKWNSIGYHFSLNKDIQIQSTERVTFGLGLGYSYLNHSLERVFFNTQHQSVDTELPSPNDSLIYSRLTIHQFYIPFELRFKSLGWKHVKFILGARLGIQPTIFSKIKFWEDEQEQYSEDRMQDMRWLYTAVYCRFGIRNWSLIGIFNPLSLFPSEQSVQLRPFQIGLSLSLF